MLLLKSDGIAIFAGLFETDGCISISYNERVQGFVFELTITQKSDQPLLASVNTLVFPTNISFKNGNLRWKTHDSVKKMIKAILPYLHGNKLRDCLIVLEMFNLLGQRKGRSHSVDVNQKIIDLRYELHNGETRQNNMTRSEFERRLNVMPNSSIGAASDLIRKINVNYIFTIFKMFKAIKANTYKVNPFYVSGLTLGDGSFFLVYGKNRVVPGFTLSLDFKSRFVILVAQYLIAGQLTKVIDPKNNSARLAYVSFGRAVNNVIPFFNKYPLLLGKKIANFYYGPMLFNE